MICLSKKLSDTYINMFAQGAGLPIQDYDQDIPDQDILIRGLGKRKLIHWCWENKKTFYYMDSGYIGNNSYEKNLKGIKFWHRIVKNDLQHQGIIDRPEDRWKKIGIDIEKRKYGEHILLVVPSEKPCKFYEIDYKTWISNTVDMIKTYTDRKIKIREKPTRHDRIHNKTIFDDLKGCHAMVTLQSIAAVESVLYGIPAFTLAPTAADPVSNKDLSVIENPYWPDKDLINKWAFHLAYGQYHIDELQDGTAYRMIYDEKC